MPKEREFVQERFRIVKEQLDDPDAVIEPEDRKRLEREHRLLGKLLAEVEEGQVKRALELWRVKFGESLAGHRALHREQQQTYDNWLALPWSKREHTPKPEPPSLGIEITDKSGYVWVIDDRYLLMMDDLIARLKKWLGTVP